MEEFKEFEALYDTIQDLAYEQELGKRFFFSGTEPEHMPVAWFSPFIRRAEDGTTSKSYATYRSFSARYLEDLSSKGTREVEAYTDIVRRLYVALGKLTPYVNVGIFAYDVIQVMLSLTEEWEQTQEEMLEFSRQVLNPFAVFAGQQSLPLHEDLKSLQNFINRYETLFINAAKQTTRRLLEIQQRRDVFQYLEEDLAAYTERNYPEVEDVEELYEFTEIKSRANVITKNFSLTLNYRGQRVYPANLMTVFDNMHCWERVPYIVCTDADYKKITKVYTGKDTDERVPYDRIVLEKKRGFKRFTIEFTIWLGHGTIETTRVGSFFRAVADFNTGKIFIKLPVSKTGNYTKELHHVFSNFGVDLQVEDIGEPESFSSETEFKVPPGFEFHEFLFYDLLLTNPLFSNNFYYDERVVPISRRKVMKFYYVPYLSRDFRNEHGEPVFTPISWSLSFKYEESRSRAQQGVNISRIRVFISNTTQEPMEQLIKDLLQCFRLYHIGLHYAYEAPELLQNIQEIYQMYIRSFNRLIDAETEWRTDQVRILKRERRAALLEEGLAIADTGKKTYQHRELAKAFPHVFGPGFPKMCRGKAAPQAFQFESVAIVEAKRMAEQTGQYIPPMPFPLENPEMWIVASDPSFPYPTIIKNIDPETQDAYPYLPCSSTTPSEKDVLYQSIYGSFQQEAKETGGTRIKDVIKTREHETATDKFLEPGAYGELEPKFRELLQLENAYTFGVSYPSKNSLLHCVLYAKQLKYYRDHFVGAGLVSKIQESQRKREALMKAERKALSALPPVLALQELYNYTEAEISEMVKDPDVFLDSRLFYRFLEERYNINIFVFSNAPDENKRRFPAMEIPRSSVYHTREIRKQRPSLLLLRNYGPTILLSLNRQPQYEIIRKRNGEMLFGSTVTELCYYLLTQSQTVLTWMPSSSGDLQLSAGISFMHNFSTLFGNATLSQIVDQAGYTRVINFQHKTGKMSVLVPPSQPLKVSNKREYHRTTEKNALLAFKNLTLTGCSRRGESVVGLWFSYLGMQQGLYVPTEPFVNDTYLTLSRDPFEELSVTESVTEPILRMRETANFLKQLFVWVYAIYKQEEVVYSWDDFLSRYVGFGDDDEPYYLFEELAEELPPMKTVTDALAYLANNTEGLIVEGKLYCYNKRLHDKIVYFLYTHDKYTEGLVTSPPTRINNYFSLQKFTNTDKNVRIFLNRSEFREWMEEVLESGGRIPTVVSRVTVGLTNRRLPFVMETDEGYFLTQNVPESVNNPSAAKNIGANWLETGVNALNYTGGKEYPVVSYVVTKSQTAMPRYIAGKGPIKEQVGTGAPFLRVLLYGNLSEIKDSNYLTAAMLPI